MPMMTNGALPAATPATPGPAAGQRTTRQRRAVSLALEELDEFRSAQAIHEILRDRGESVGLSTVYRTLQGLVDAGEVDVLRMADGEAHYRHCSRGHHHHLVCRDCGRTVEVEGIAVERWAAKTAARHGFHDVSHTLEVFGVCDDCHR
jgi:Fur family ferric uptake transcriptional regulator